MNVWHLKYKNFLDEEMPGLHADLSKMAPLSPKPSSSILCSSFGQLHLIFQLIAQNSPSQEIYLKDTLAYICAQFCGSQFVIISIGGEK